MMINRKKYYHWIILSVLFVEQVVYGGLLNNLSGMFLIPVCESLEMKRLLFSVAISLRTIGAIVSTLFSGVLKTYFSNKRLMTTSMLVVSISCVIMGTSRNVVHLSIGFALLGLCDGFCYTAAVTRILTAWFHTHQGLVLGAVTAGSGIGGSLICYVLTFVMDQFGWRAGFYACSILTILLTLMLQVLLYDRPENIGAQPFGVGKKSHKRISADRHWLGLEKRELTRKAVFYILLCVILIVTLCAQMGLNLVIPYFQDNGFSANQTALLQSVVMIVLALSKLASGVACDSLGVRKVMVICTLSIGGGVFLMTISQGMIMAIIAMILLGFGLPVMTVLVPLLAQELFGYRTVDALLGVYLSTVSVAGLASGFVSNAFFDKYGSYREILLVAVFSLIVSILLLLAVYHITTNMRSKRSV